MLNELKGKVFPVLNEGHIVLMDCMGADQDVVQAARTSYQTGTVKVSDDRTLIRYLMRHRHTTPFESCQLKFHVKLPIFVERQWARHRTAGWNEVSARYSELPEEFYIPNVENVRAQSKTNKQGRDEELSQDVVANFIESSARTARESFAEYHNYLEGDIARELARISLPLSTYTEKVWWMNLHNILHFLSLRMDSHAQKEIREYAIAMGEQIIAPLFPLVWEAFEDYRLGGLFLSRLDIEVIQNLRLESAKCVITRATKEDGHAFDPEDYMMTYSKTFFLSMNGIKQWEKLTKCRERDECLEKLQRMGLIMKGEK